MIARFTHQYSTWLWEWHTIPNWPDAKAFEESTNFWCMLLLTYRPNIPKYFSELITKGWKKINFFGLLPLYKEEMEFKLDQWTDALIDKMANFWIEDIYDMNRKNSCL